VKARLLIFALTTLVMASALGVIASKHHSRELYYHLQVLRHKKAQLQTQWAQLQLEENAWANQGRVQRMASQKLDMKLPKHFSLIRVKQ
jgi:cell division protein FtsL